MEQQAQIGDEVHGILKHEFAMLKIATGEVSNSINARNVEQHPISFNPPFFATPQQQPILPSNSINARNVEQHPISFNPPFFATPQQQPMLPSNSINARNVEQHPISFNPPFFTTPQQQPILPYQNIQLQPTFHQPMPPATNHHLLSQPRYLHSDMRQHDPLSSLQGLEVNPAGSTISASESSTTNSASESSTTF